MVDETNTTPPPNRTTGTTPTQSGGNMQTLRTAKGKIGIAGIVIVVILAIVFHVNPMQALALFGGNNQPTSTTQTTQPANTQPANTQTGAPAPQQSQQ